MVFSSMVFLWIFLPCILVLYYFIKDKYKNVLLLIASLIFYAWGEPKYIILMLVAITVNWYFGILIEKYNKYKFFFMVAVIVIDILLLFYFKYFNLLADFVNTITSMQVIETKNIALPIGISFYTFQAMSYIIDLYRGEIKVQKNWYKLSLYIAFFPALIAGPIVKYRDICDQIDCRECTIEKFSYGVKRFIYGLGKKVIVANTMASIVDNILNIETVYIGTGLSWCIALCYTLQIYFDFSGYSDMAIGLGKMFGFDILENFNYPYISESIQEFWRRWHISLSTWFREYLYIPLGGNRRGKLRTYFNLFIVFFVTGLWHGANYTFIVWGLYHGFFSILERLFLGKALKNNPIKIINHLYAIIVFVVGWVLFRADNIGQAMLLIKNMFIYKADVLYRVDYFMNVKNLVIFIAAILISTVIPILMKKLSMQKFKETACKIEILPCTAIILYSIWLLICDTYNSFIYFRF